VTQILKNVLGSMAPYCAQKLFGVIFFGSKKENQLKVDSHELKVK
jgi:hypothetical protein